MSVSTARTGHRACPPGSGLEREMNGRDASCRSPAARPAAMLVVCSAARCISPAKARAPQLEWRPRAMPTDVSSGAGAAYGTRAGYCGLAAARAAVRTACSVTRATRATSRAAVTAEREPPGSAERCWSRVSILHTLPCKCTCNHSTCAFVSSKAASRASDCSSSCSTVGR